MKCVVFPALGVALLASTGDAAKPGTPTIGWGDYTYQLVEVDQSAVAYKQLVKSVKTSINVSVSWDMWGGAEATSTRLLLSGTTVWEGSGSDRTATFEVSSGGSWDMEVEHCNDEGCSVSAPKKLMVADTDGSHMAGLDIPLQEDNKPCVRNHDKWIVTYFVEWGVYGRAFPLDKTPVQNLTHLLYGFIPICGGDGLNDGLKSIPNSFENLQRACSGTPDFEVAIHDPWAALQKPQKQVSAWSDPYKGNYGQMMDAKKKYPHLRILPSIGGWTLSDPFFFMHDENNFRTFINSCEKFLRTWKFWDGLDIDWEFPGQGGQSAHLGNPEQDKFLYTKMMKELRKMMDKLGEETGRYYELTSANSANSDKVAFIDYNSVVPYMDKIFLMSYDFYGAWDLADLNHQTALYEGKWKPSKFTTDKGVKALLAQGVPNEKICVGIAMYGRGWKGITGSTVDNPLAGTSSGAIKGTWEAGVKDYRDIKKNCTGGGWTYLYDEVAEAPLSYNHSTGELLTYDDYRSAKAKGEYCVKNNLGGLLSWEIDADTGDILNGMCDGLNSGGGSPTNPTTARPTTTTSSTRRPSPPTPSPPTPSPPTPSPPTPSPPTPSPPTPSTTTTPSPSVGGGGSGKCSSSDPDAGNHPAYDSEKIYNTGDVLSHNNLVWKAKYWVQGTAPSRSADAFALVSKVELPWDSKVAYPGGSEIDHDGQRWRNKWYSSGDEPGKADVWESIGPALC